MARWVPPALRQDVIWCQLFSEPDAGSDAAGIKTRGTRVDGGWLVNGQKVWTSGAHYSELRPGHHPHRPRRAQARGHHHHGHRHARRGRRGAPPAHGHRATRSSTRSSSTTSSCPTTTWSGPVNGGWTVARATLGNESVSIGGGQGGRPCRPRWSSPPSTPTPSASAGGAGRIGRYIAQPEAMAVLNMRSAHRAVIGGGPGPRGQRHQAGALRDRARGGGHRGRAAAAPRRLSSRAPGRITAAMVLMHRAHVDRRRHVGDQAQPDRRAHPRPAPGPADQVARHLKRG